MELKQIKKQNKQLQLLKEIPVTQKGITLQNQMYPNVQECINKITTKMTNAKIQTVHPPYFEQTLTLFRQQCYGLLLKNQISKKLSSETTYKQGLQLLGQFIENFDNQYIDIYAIQIKQPYIRKIFNEGYQIDKVNFRKLNSEYELRKQIQEVLAQTSEWLVQIQLLQDMLNRIELYFGVSYKSIMQKLKSKGAQERKGGWTDYLVSLIRKTGSYGLRKCSKIVQNSYYASLISPAFTILTWAIIGGTSTLPWSGGIDYKSFLIPAIAFTIPYFLDNMAQGIERKDFQAMLTNWAIQFSQVNDRIKHFSNLLQEQIRNCSRANTYQQFLIHRTNLLKYIESIQKNVEKISKYEEKQFNQMKERTQAYYKDYIEVQQDGWIHVYSPEQYEKYKNNSNKQ